MTNVKGNLVRRPAPLNTNFITAPNTKAQMRRNISTKAKGTLERTAKVTSAAGLRKQVSHEQPQFIGQLGQQPVSRMGTNRDPIQK